MRLRFPGPGLFVALLALTCQFALGASVPRTADPLAAFGLICHADGAGHAPAGPLHRGPNCQSCPLSTAFTTAAHTPLSGATISLRATERLARAAPRRLAAVAPAISLLSARPRGPPATA